MTLIARALIVTLAITASCGGCSHDGVGKSADGTGRQPLYYRDPMDAGHTSPVPAKDDMGMDFVPVFADGAGGGDGIRLSTGMVQNLGLRTAQTVLSPLPEEISGGGVVDFDERATIDIFVPTNGWLQKLSVRTVGESVAAGQLLFELYSPSLVTTDTLYLSAGSETDPTRNPYIAALRALGLTDELIADVREKRRAPGHIPFRAVTPATVTQLCCKPGALVTQGMSVLRLAPSGATSVTAYLPASAVASIDVGARAHVAGDGFPGRTFEARVSLVYADLDPVSHLLRARLDLLQNDGSLKPNMYVSAVIDGRGSQQPVLHIPREAVIRDGGSEHVVVAMEGGRFAPRVVKLGRESAGDVAILEGLRQGEHVVTTGVFLLGAEANIRAGLGRLGSSAGQQEAAGADPPPR